MRVGGVAVLERVTYGQTAQQTIGLAGQRASHEMVLLEVQELFRS